jgi:MFS family permease
MPTVLQYIQSVGGADEFYSTVMSSFSLSRTVFFVAFGLWSDRRNMKEPFLFSFAICILGDLMYCAAQGYDSYPLILFGRLICGIGSANSTLTQAYIARAASPDKRTKLLATCNGWALIGIMCGPVFAVLLNDLDIQFGRFHINQFTAPGCKCDRPCGATVTRPHLFACPDVMAVVNTLSLIGFWLYFEEPPPDKTKVVMDAKFRRMVRLVMYNRAAWFCLLVPYPPSLRRHTHSHLLQVNFIIGFEITALETAVPPITQQFHPPYGTTQTSLLFAGIAVVAVVAIAATIFIDRQPWASDRGIIGGSFVVTGLSFVVAFVFCSGEEIPLFGLLAFGSLFIFGIMMMNAPNTTM